MALTYIETKQGYKFIFDEVPDQLRDRMRILFGYGLTLRCDCVITDKNQAGAETYSDYLNASPVQLCNKDDIKLQRDANDAELKIYNTIKSGKKLSSADRKYLKRNFLNLIDHRTQGQLDLF